MLHRTRPALAAALCVLLPVTAFACGHGSVQFSDDFKTPDPGWGTKSVLVTLGNGQLAITPHKNAGTERFNFAYIYPRADVCVQMKTPDFTAADGVVGGLAFWATSYNAFYQFHIAPDKSWGVFRWLPSHRWVTILSGSSDAIKPQPGAVNEVELRLDGNAGEAWVNGTKLASFHGQPPEGGGAIGLYAESEATRRNTWGFTDFKVLNLPQ
jgi:hypothetical protein